MQGKEWCGVWEERGGVWEERGGVWEERSGVWEERGGVWEERSSVWEERSGVVCGKRRGLPLKRKVTAHTTRTSTGQKSMMSRDTKDSMVVFCALRPHVLDFPSAPEDWAAG